MEFSSTIPGTPSIKRQKTLFGYTTTLSHDNRCEETGKIVPKTPGPRHNQSAQVTDHSKVPLQTLSPTKTHDQNHVQVPASSPLKAPKSPCRENSSELSKTTTGLHAYGTLNSQSKSPSSPVKNKVCIDLIENSFNNTCHKGLETKTNRSILMASLDEKLSSGQEESSDDETYISPNIRPVRFSQGNSQNEPSRIANTGPANSRFQNIIQSSAYKGISLSNRQYTDPKNSFISPSIANQSSGRPKPITSLNGNGNKLSGSLQARMERAQPIDDIALEDISDDDMKVKINRMRTVFPSISILKAKDALTVFNGNFEQAVNLVADGDVAPKSSAPPERITISLIPEDDSDCEVLAMEPEPQMKRTLKAPMQSIRNRYSSTQALQPNSSDTSQLKDPKKQRRRLVQGRKNLSIDESPHDMIPAKPQSSLGYESLSEIDSDVESVVLDEDERLEARVLKYLNTCEVTNLIELANITKEIAETMLAERPFESIDAARTVENVKKLKSGKKSSRSLIGDRIVDTTMEMFRGYDAIDTLVEKCVELSKPLVSEISQWGFDVNGAQKNGELEMTSLENIDSPKRRTWQAEKNLISPIEADEEVKTATKKRNTGQFLKKPKLMAEDIDLKDYQVVGMNWLALMSRNGLSGILADEMGLGKTCQVISFLAHLVETGNTGPHLVICPGSTLENWLREIHRFAPMLTFEPYHGPQKERQAIADEILMNKDNINIIVTTYDMATKKEDNKFMRRLKADVCVYDEGHMLKNVKSQRYQSLIRIPARLRILLTGTPLQNNLQELAALLAFILPNLFKDLEEDLNTIFKAKATTSDSDHAALLSTQRIDRARSILTPFVLRRKKAQVLKHLPAKHCRTEYCSLFKAQKKIYDGHIQQAQERARLRLEGVKAPKTEENNPLMQLRKASIHPLLFRRHFDDAKIEKMVDILRKKEPQNFPSSLKREHLVTEMHNGSDFWLHQWCREYPCIAKFDIPDLAWMESGKIEAMVKLVEKYKENGDRVLLFSQFSLVLDIIEAVLNTCRIHYTRIDGSTKIDERQSLIDAFRDDESITVFLLTTKAGGTGINLMYANKVIIFDGSFNPQDDKQAENRAHRVGQTRKVEVVRLVTRGTIEEQILALGDSKLRLDGRVAGDEETMGEDAVARMLLSQACTSETEDTKPEEKNDHNKVENTKKTNATEKTNAIEKTNGTERKNAIEKTNGTERKNATEKTNGTERKNATEKTNGTERKNAIEKPNGTERKNAKEKTNATERTNAAKKTNTTDSRKKNTILNMLTQNKKKKDTTDC